MKDYLGRRELLELECSLIQNKSNYDRGEQIQNFDEHRDKLSVDKTRAKVKWLVNKYTFIWTSLGLKVVLLPSSEGKCYSILFV